ncbi:thioredoxin domain-containing protein [uncultured Micrococcus sp.]|uniref:DsbA family protein n=1 Tax=uncultured Micrococcus sp. TaxID=114051 RepID=UPI0025CF5AD9|nr:thioredoxin domain-containing protein [uncultured Micrococcus sp.]
MASRNTASAATDARTRARQMQAEQQRKDRRKRTAVIWGSVLAALLLIGLVVALVTRAQGDGDIPTAGPMPAAANVEGGVVLTSPTALADPGLGERQVDAATVQVPEGPVERPADSAPGAQPRAEGGPAHVVVYADFNCVHCAAFEQENAALLAGWLADGKATVEYRMVDFLSAPNNQNFSARAANAAYCVAEQAPEHYNAFVTDVFGAYEGHGGKGLSDDELAQRAEALGADVSDCMEQDTYRPAVAYTTQKAKAAPIQGTPTVYVDGQWWTREQAFQEWASPIVEG